ncbi:MAG: sorbosone dehydrogenase family protein [Ignavibacteriaceae bacterium]
MLRINIKRSLGIVLSIPLFVITLYCNPGSTDQQQSDNKLGIKLPAGFNIEVYADNIDGARSMVMSESGILFVGTRDNDKVYAVVDNNNDYKADEVITIGSGFKSPNGVALRNGALYVAEISKIWRYDNIEDNLKNSPQPVLVSDKYPSDGHHGWKYIAFGPDDKLYVPVGAPCNVCLKDNEIYSSITRMNPDGSGQEIFAHGIRNTVGFDWHPDTKELWFTDNGRDMLGDDVPPDELNRAPESGMHFGFPFIHGNDIKDPEFGEGKDPGQYTRPVQALGPHVAALGMEFYTGNMFPAEYKNQIFIAEHGSWNRSEKIGYRVMLVKLEGNNAVSYEPFAEGWLNGNSVSGRPVDVEVMNDGSMLVSDDYAGVIYRISYNK